MIANKEHIIKSQQFEISLEDPKKGHDVQSAISVLQSSRIEKQLNAILERFSQEGKVYHFDSVVLDIGTIANWNFEEELVFRLEEALIHFFNTQILSSGSLKNGKEIILKNKELDQLEHFLLWGYFLWNSSPNQSAKGLMKQLLEENEEGLVDLFIRLGKKEIVRKRIIFQFGDDVLDTLVIVVAKKEGESIVAYKNNIIASHQKDRLVEESNANFKSAVWEVVLSYLFVETNGYYHKKNFLEYLIRKTAQKYNLGYDYLLMVIAKGIQSHKWSKQEDEFGRIVLELSQGLPEKKEEDTDKSPLNISIEKQFIHFMEFGSFSILSQPKSRYVFQERIKKHLKSQPQNVENYLLRRLIDSKSVLRIIHLLDNNNLMTLIKNSNNLFLVRVFSFFSAIENKITFTTPNSKALFKKAINHKYLLILNCFISKKRNIEYELLKELETFFYRDNIPFLQLLKEISPWVSSDYKEIIRLFLSKKEGSGIVVHKQRNIKEISFEDYLTASMKLPKEQWEHVCYVLENGALPWWNFKYTLRRFNLDFAKLWKELKYRLLIKKNAKEKRVQQVLASFLSNENLVAIYKTLVGYETSLFFNRILKLYQTQPLSLQNRLSNSYMQFKISSIKWGLYDRHISNDDFLNLFFNDWRDTLLKHGKFEEVQTIIVSFIALKKNIKGTRLKVAFEKVIAVFLQGSTIKADIPLLENTLKLYAEQQQISIATRNILNQMVSKHPEKFIKLLSNKTFGIDLLCALETADEVMLVGEVMNDSNKGYFNKLMVIMDGMSIYISKQQLWDIKREFFLKLFINIDNNKFAFWNKEKWSDLFARSIKNVLKGEVAYEVIKKLTEKGIGKAYVGKEQELMQLLFHEIGKGLEKTLRIKPNASNVDSDKRETYKKLGDKDGYEFINPIFIKNAGLIILSPFLRMLFERCGIMDTGEFHDVESKYKAVHLLQYAATGKVAEEEYELSLNKLLCGITVTDPVPVNISLKESEKEIVHGMLKAVTAQWKALNQTSIQGFQNSFLNRSGKLEDTGQHFYLSVEQLSYDMLVDQIPWSIGKIKLSWMQKILEVSWR